MLEEDDFTRNLAMLIEDKCDVLGSRLTGSIMR
jgi:hypothetical protein